MTEGNHDPVVEVAQDIQPPRRSDRLGTKKRVGYQEHITTSGSTFLTEQDIYDHGTSYYAAFNVENFSPDPKHEHEAGPEWMDAELQEIANLDKYGVFRDVGDINTLQQSEQSLGFRIVYKTKFSATGEFEKRNVHYDIRGDQDRMKNEVDSYAACVDHGITLLCIVSSAFLGWEREFMDEESAYLIPQLSRPVKAKMTRVMKIYYKDKISSQGFKSDSNLNV